MNNNENVKKSLLIIENESQVDRDVLNFIEDFRHLFSSIHEELFCKDQHDDRVLTYVLNNDAIIAASTWMYKKQVYNYLTAFNQPDFPKKDFYIYRATDTLNSWLHKKSTYYDCSQLSLLVRNLIKKGFSFYDFKPDIFSVEIKDCNPGIFQTTTTRNKFHYSLIKYSEEYNLFYNDLISCTLDEVKEEYGIKI